MNDFTFTPGKGLGGIDLAMSPEQLEELLGKPDEIEEESDESIAGLEDKTVSWEYEQLGLSLLLFYYDGTFEGFHIFSSNIIMGGDDLYELDQPAIVAHMHKAHEQIGADYEYQLINRDDEQYRFYPHLGLTIWLEEGQLTDVCISEVFTPEQRDEIADELLTED